MKRAGCRVAGATSAFSLAVLVGLTLPSVAADWPTWRHDAQRSGVTAEQLPDRLQLQWVRELPAFEPAWPVEPRLQFDASYQPVAAAGRLFVGSPVDGSVTAYDADTGRELWTFNTEGPVRCAPAVWEGAVYVGSDDGWLYCLDAATGSLRWKVRGVPDDRPDYRHLGNNRLISFWPVRGGPVVVDGVVYFGVGLWPTLGVFVEAVDARTGRRLWVNDRVGYLRSVRVDHNDRTDVGLSPQGYCLFVDGKLVVPSGRSMPARFDPKTGRMLYYVQGYRNGDARVVASQRLLFVGERGVVRIEDGREVGSRWAEAGQEAPEGWNGAKRDLFEGPYFGYKFLPACDYRSVFDGRAAYGVERGRLYGYDLSRARISLYEKKVDNLTLHPARWDAPRLWPPLPLADADAGSTQVSIKAGSRLYTHVDDVLFAVELPRVDAARAAEPSKASAGQVANQRPRVVWKQKLDGVPASMLAANGKLFVVLSDGRLCCFGAKPGEPKRYAAAKKPLAEQNDAWTDLAHRLLEVSGVREGCVLVLGLDQGRLVEELLRQSRLRVFAVDADAATVYRLRRRLVRAGLYGRRAEVLVGEPTTFLFPPYLANLVVSEQPGPDGPLGSVPAERLCQLLRPYGGTACVREQRGPGRSGAETKLAERWRAARVAGVEVVTLGEWTLLRRPDALPGAADWTHECADAGRSYFSKDERVRHPLAVLWYGDGPDYGFHKWKDYGRGVKPQVCRGRLFAFNDRTRVLRAVDIYTGRRLWEYKTPTPLVRFVSLPDGVYVAHGLHCDVLDPATGRRRQRFRLNVDVPSGQSPGVVGVRATDDLLVVAVGFNLPTHHSHPAIEQGLWDARVLVALDRRTGRQLWVREATDRFNLHAVAVGGGRVYCVDSKPPRELDRLRRRGQAAKTFPSTLLVLDERTGRELWRRTFQYPPLPTLSWLSIRANDDWVAYNATHEVLLTGKVGQIHALDAKTGRPLWHQPGGGQQPLIVADDWFLTQAGLKYDVRTGELSSEQPLFRRGGGCNYAVATRHLVFLRRRCATYVELDRGVEHSLRTLRSGCSNSLVAAGGLLNVPCYAVGCVCNYPLQTSFALFHLPDAAGWEPSAPLELAAP